MKRFILIICILLGVAICEAQGPHVEMIREDVVGIVLNADGETPVADLPVRVWNVKSKKMVHRSKTDADGVFRIPELDVQDCYVFVGKVKMNLKVVASTSEMYLQQHDIIVVLPRRLLIASSPQVFDVIVAPVLMRPPPPPKVVSP